MLYQSAKENFLSRVEQDTITIEIENNIYERRYRHTAKNEFRAWKGTFGKMEVRYLRDYKDSKR